MSELLAIGVSHKTAPVEVRERLALPEARVAEFTRELRGAAEVHEAVAISTCNRTELYLVVGDPVEAESTVLAMLARQAGIRPTGLATAIYSHHNCDAARHLYRVVAGLESMIIGEAEIQGQVKRAYETALALETTGPLTNRLFKAALATGKRVRTETAIGQRQLSLPGVAVALAREQLGELAGREVVILGTGETSELTARALADSGTRTVFVANRRRDRALSLARRYGGRTLSFDELPEALLTADIVVAATASPHLLLEVNEVAAVMQERGGRPMLLIDLAVPRDIDAACAELSGDRPARHRRPPGGRRSQPQGAPGRGPEGRGDHRGGDPAVRGLAWLTRGAAHAGGAARPCRCRSPTRWCRRTPAGGRRASPRDLERIEAMARALVNRLLHAPTQAMKEMHDDRVHARMALVRDLFGLRPDDGPAQELAEVHELPARPRARGSLRT